ncbi:hypothetical protein [Prosthecomicrobium pneumaticum]|uniref:Putative small lipoprotein YifL n=1 Tax=Prosthecomicrobium pneumaticum TaxID=81895 RepID=A0A7W9L3V9_9HYPH|nr:hypothetical protein [Prosthecomicrobium pneumaticum]MBB5754958.1 putative small lipoprotein YifL [Prosthecomicrobium pneumaticum]
MTDTILKTAALAALLALAGCGANGAPEPPPGSAQAEAAKADPKLDTSKPEKPKRDLFLDRLL